MKGFVAEYENVDLDTLVTSGTFCLTNNPSGGSYHDPSTLTTTYTAKVDVTVDSVRRVSQILTVVKGAGQAPESYMRSSGRNEADWSDWSRNDAFGCKTALDLASLLGVGNNGAITDCNTCTSPGYYIAWGSIENGPIESGLFILQVFRYSETDAYGIAQLIFCTESNRAFYRTKSHSLGGWRPWKEL